jgi:hypothetical protein
MTYRRWMAARQLLMEEHLGTLLREGAHREDQAFNKAKANSRR